MKWFQSTKSGLAFAACCLTASAVASVTIGGTRVVYPLDQREVTVKLDNDSHTPSLVQVWIDDGDAEAKPGDAKVPFVITPPIFRMDPKKAQTLRIMYSGEALPTDRESVYWLNVLDIPPKQADAASNSLQLAYRTRIKVFARPASLPGKPEEAPAQLTWRLTDLPDDDPGRGPGPALSVSNPTPYYVSFSEVAVESGGRTYHNELGGMVAPRASTRLPIDAMNGVASDAKVHYTAISDYGGAISGDAALGH